MECSAPQTPAFNDPGANVAEFHGESVPDPFRWMEAADSAAITQWVEAQHECAGEFLASRTLLPHCREFLQRNHVCVDPPWRCRRGEREFFLSRQAGRYPLICMATHGSVHVLVDPNENGSALDVDNVAISPSGRYVAFALSAPGELLATLHTYDVDARVLMESSAISTAMPMIAWHPSEYGYYHSVCRRLFFPDERNDGAYWHTLGGDWTTDFCVKPYNDGPGHLAYVLVPEGSEHLLVFTHQFSSGRSGVGLCRLDETCPQVERVPATTTLFEELEAQVEFVGVARRRLYFQFCREGSTGEIAAIDPTQPTRSCWQTVVPAGPLALGRPEHFPGPLKAAVSEAALLATCIEDAHEVLFHFDLDGRLKRRIDLPTPSTIDAVAHAGEGFEIYTQSFLVPRVVYCYEPSGTLAETTRVTMPGVDPDTFKTRQVFYAAKDGTRIPMYVLQRHDCPRDGAQPLLLYGYGGFGQSITPECMPDIALWLDLGGTFALANIRGGGEYGESWHAGGCGINKQTSFDDFYAAAEYLVAEGYTSPRRLCIKGISNGGLLTAVCVNQRPDLFAAVVSEVPLVDVLALERSETGRACFVEYGNARTDPEVFEVQRRYSPIHNLRPDGIAPPQFVVAAEKDMSAPPLHIYRYVAARQQIQRRTGRETPVLLRLLHGEGHTHWPHEAAGSVIAEEIAFLRHFVG